MLPTRNRSCGAVHCYTQADLRGLPYTQADLRLAIRRSAACRIEERRTHLNIGYLLVLPQIKIRLARKMGCFSSKIMMKSASFREELNRSLRRRTNGLEEIPVSKDGEDQLQTLICTANTVSRRLKEKSPPQEPSESKNSTADHTNSISKTSIQTIDTWELLSGLEEDKQVQGHQSVEGPNIVVAHSKNLCKTEEDKFIIGNDSIGSSRSFRTVEDFDAMIAANRQKENSEQEVEKPELKGENIDRAFSTNEDGVVLEKDFTREKGLRRKAMAKELTLQVPTVEFSRGGSLKDWLLVGGELFSPGSYVTPKFGNFISPGSNNGENTIVFDPELVEHFEQAMKELTMEEECILKEIIEKLDGGNEEDI